jgi:hypothetical protein
VVRLLGSLGRVAQARLRDAGRRATVRAVLAASCVLAGLIAFGFALGAATVALAHEIGTVRALLAMAAGAFLLMLILIGVLSWQAKRDRQQAAIRAELDSRLMRAAAISMVPTRLPSRPVLGLGLVALGAVLVLLRRDGDRKD